MRNKGFTLIELVVTVAIIAILAAIAYPAYQHYVMKTRRAAAQSCLLELAQFMERFYATNLRYHQDRNGNPVALPNTQCSVDLAASYNLGFLGQTTATTFTLQAIAQGPQAADAACSPLTVDQAGSRGPSGCW
jgi:type IV pilus assembly protein PilE